MRKVKMPDNNTNPTTAPGIPPVDSSVVPENVMPMPGMPMPGMPMPSGAPMNAAPADNAPVNNAPVDNVPTDNTASSGSDDATKAASDKKSSVIVDPNMPVESMAAGDAADMPVQAEVANKIAESKNVLIALSGDPSVDEMASAIGLSMFLDKLGKRATAIYSGTTPNALEFLRPEETFEPTADTLQDFVVALNKDKADHLRYKLDGDYVKIYITPYKTRISEEDLDFSYGDYNVDLVLALDVANGVDLDSALREHGRIMHDAVIINITTGNPGRFGEIEWSDKHASSISEMIAKLLYSTSSSDKIGKEEATAFLTGIVAATNRFSNASTTPETMQIASKLMDSGANQQLVSKNITPDIENEMFSLSVGGAPAEEAESSPADLSIDHEKKGIDVDDKESSEDLTEENKTEETEPEEKKEEEVERQEEKPEPYESSSNENDNSLLDDLKAAEESLSQTGAETTPEEEQESVKIDSENNTSNMDEVSASTETTSETPVAESPEPVAEAPAEQPVAEPVAAEPVAAEPIAAPAVEPVAEPTPQFASEPGEGINSLASTPSDPEARAIEAPAQEKVLQPSSDFNSSPMTLENENKYGKMLESALESVSDGNDLASNPAVMSAPEVASSPEINGVPEMNFMPPSDEEIIPPPPAPPVDMTGMMPGGDVPPVGMPPTETPVMGAPVATDGAIAPAAPEAEPAPESLGEQPAMQDQVYAAQAADPAAFKIPGT